MTREDEVFKMLSDLFHGAHDRLAGHHIVLFGSRARGDAKPRSDFDIGIIGESPLPLADYYALEDQLEDLPTLYRIDWVDLMRVGKKFRQEALSNIRVIYEG